MEVLSVTQELGPSREGEDLFLHELLFFPEFTSFGTKLPRLQTSAKVLAKDAVGRQDLTGLGGRTLPGTVETGTLTLLIKPGKREEAHWGEPLELRLPILTWRHGNEAAVAYVPALGIEVVASRAERLPEMLESHGQFALRRLSLARSILELARLQRMRSLRVERLAWNASPATTREHYKNEYGDDEEKKKSVLAEVATAMTPLAMTTAYEREADVERLARCLTGRRPGSVLLVGPSGCGKSALVRELVRTKAAHKLAARTFWKTSGGRIVAGQTGYGMWQERCTALAREAKERNAILFLGGLFELMQVGQSSASTESIASFLRPAMVRGDFLAVAECTPPQLAAIEAHDPKILDAFRILEIHEPDRPTGRRILEQVANEYALSARKSTYRLEALDRLDALHRRYAAYSAYPGRALHFLKALRSESGAREIDEADVVESFAKETGLPRLLLDDALPFDAEATAAWFGTRVMAQDAAALHVVDAIAAIKTRLARPGKPLTSFLFIGPTGVGKTELAKALAEFLYGNRERMVRFDMSEFSAPWSAERLVSSGFTCKEGLLTAAVREEPFSVLLLDEFEKAAPEVYDLFLQVLGEGRLTDAAGRVADFTNSVIILTSNLGAASFGRGTMGFESGTAEVAATAAAHFEAAVRNAVRPEFFNRIDRIIPFLPLSRASVERIAVRELALAEGRDGLRRDDLTLQVAEGLRQRVLKEGYDIRYGARPLRRAIERRLLVPLADALNKTPRARGVLALEETSSGRVGVRFTEASGNDGAERQSAAIMASAAAVVRRELSILEASSMVSELRSEAFRIKQGRALAESRARKRKAAGYVPFDKEQERRLEALDEIVGRVERLLGAASRCEEAQLVAFALGDLEAVAGLAEAPTKADCEQALLDCLAVSRNDPPEVSLTFCGDDGAWTRELAACYRQVMSDLGSTVKGAVFLRNPREGQTTVSAEGERRILPELLTKKRLDDAIAGRINGVGSLALSFAGGMPLMWLCEEAGVHVDTPIEGAPRRCKVEVFSGALDDLSASWERLQRAPNLKKDPVRRNSLEGKGHCRDAFLAKTFAGNFSGTQLHALLRETVLKAAREAL